MKKKSRHFLSKIDYILILDKKRTILTIVSLLVLAVLAPLKSFIAQWLIDSSTVAAVIRVVLLGITVVALNHLFEYIARSTFNHMVTQSVTQIREKLCENLAQMSLNQVHTISKDSWQAAYTNDLKLVCDDYYFGIFNMAMWGSMGLVAVIYMAIISPALLIVSLAMIVFPFLGPKFFASNLSRTKSEYAKSYNVVCTKINEALHGLESVITCNNRDFAFQKVQKASDENVQKDRDMKQMAAMSQIITSLITWIPGFVIMVSGALLVVQGKLTISYLITANTLLNFIISPFRQVTNSYLSVKSAKAVKERIEKLLAQKSEAEKEVAPVKITSIDIKNLSFAYDKADVIKNVNLCITKGSKTAIVGISGSGKSTIMMLLGRFYPSYRGMIYVNGDELRSLSDTAFYSSVGYIPQEPFIYADTIRNNICLGRAYSDHEVKDVVRRVGLSDLISSLPDGVDTMLTENGLNISGGQKKRIAIARALIRSCDTLLIDEMTSSLDIKTTDEIVKLILSFPCTVIMITHDIFDSYMDEFSQIYYMENGEIVERGTYQILINNNTHFARMKAMMKKESELFTVV